MNTENSTQNEATKETTSETRNRDTSVAPVPAVLRRRITDAISATRTTVEYLDRVTLAMDDICAMVDDGQEPSVAAVAMMVEPIREARRHAKYLDTVIGDLDEKVRHAHAPQDLKDRATEIDELLGTLQAAVIHIEGEFETWDGATAKASQVAKDCFHDLRLITATMRLPSVVGESGAS